MEGKVDALFELVKGLSVDMAAGFKAVDDRFEAVDKRFDAIDDRFEAVDKHFDAVDKRLSTVEIDMTTGFKMMDERFCTVDRRFDGLELKVDNLTSECRGYFKRSEDRANTHELVIQKLSYQTNANEGRIAEIQEKLE